MFDPTDPRPARALPGQDTPAGRPAAKERRRTPALTAELVRTVVHSGNGKRSADHHSDGQGTGLYLQVMPSGSKQWVQRISLDGRRRDVGLGGLRDVTLSEARAAAMRNVADAEDYRRKVRRGEPAALPAFARPRSRRTVAAALAHGGITLGQAWEEHIRHRAPAWKNPETDTRSWRAALKHHLHALAGLPVAAVSVSALRQVLAPLAPATADKVLRRAGAVLDLAQAEGHVASNVARELSRTRRGRPRGERKHRKALPYAELPAFYSRLRAHGTDGAAGALALVLLTALRSKEGRLARWEEMDLEARVWTVPGERMKDGQAFRVPLSDAAMAVLEAAGPRRDGLVFSTRRGGPVSDKALRKVLADLAADATVHGSRSTFRDWCGENGAAREVAEGCLSHKVGSSVEQAYARSDLLERRRTVMQDWGRFVSGGAA